ncbi:MAG: CapA family protein [Patescibacteria group bacterium]|nr:CapA family protein [Patescibacteria group bacterium]
MTSTGMKWVLASLAACICIAAVFAFPALVREMPLPAPAAPGRLVTILAFGDIMLDRAVRQDIDAYGPSYPFKKIAPLLKGHDIVVANAEGVFTGNASIASFSALEFTFATSTLLVLKSLGFTDLSQANNHALNFGWSGLTESRSAIAAARMQSFGDPENKSPGPVYETVRGTTIAFVGYDQFSADGGEASSSLAAIKEAKRVGAFVIVYPHWGEEYNDGTTTLQTVLARTFVDAGADVVIGSHPHVVEPIETYKGRAIFYSLGNFIFDQSWDADVSHGLAVEISLTDKTVAYTLHPFAIIKAQAVPATSAPVSFMLERY